MIQDALYANGSIYDNIITKCDEPTITLRVSFGAQLVQFDNQEFGSNFDEKGAI